MTMPRILNIAIGLILATTGVLHAAESQPVQPTRITEWKAVYGRIEARDQIPARARLGGTLIQLEVSEGDEVTTGQSLAVIVDEKLGFQLAAVDAQLQALRSQMTNAETELTRGEELLQRGVTTVQRLDGLRTQVEVLSGQIESLMAERRVVEQRATEGSVLSPLAGRVLDVPVAVGAVVMPGEVVAMIGGGGFFLRLAVPERHAGSLQQGASIGIEQSGLSQTGTLAKIYPQIEGGRVVADVEVPGLSDAFVGTRVLVRLPVGERDALLVPVTAVTTRSGLDFVRVEEDGRTVQRTVLLGQPHEVDGQQMIEAVAGLTVGDKVVTVNE